MPQMYYAFHKLKYENINFKACMKIRSHNKSLEIVWYFSLFVECACGNIKYGIKHKIYLELIVLNQVINLELFIFNTILYN